MKNFETLATEINEWAEATFGADRDPKAIARHLKREAGEIEAEPHAILEWADALILTVNGADAAGFSPETLIAAAVLKMEINKCRKWGKPDSEGVIEHIESEGV